MLMGYAEKNSIHLNLMCGLCLFGGAFQSIYADSAPENAINTTNLTYSLWNEFYKVEKSNPQRAVKLLEELGSKTPNDQRVWKSLTFVYLDQKKPELALSSLNNALLLAPTDEQLLLQKAYILNSLERNQESLLVFKQLENTNNAEIKLTAETAIKNLQGSGEASKQSPFFADIYFSPSYEGRFDIGIFPLKIRAGRYFGDTAQGQLYGFTSFNRDTGSKGNSNPEILGNNAIIYDENSVIAGAGVSYQPWNSLPMRTYIEVGGSYDLIDRNRKKFRESIVGGVASYQEWQQEHKLCNTLKCSNLYTDAYANIASYSRENYSVLADLRLRSGFMFVNKTVQVYGKLHTINDSAHTYYNNLVEVGPGISWKPFINIPMTLRVEQVYGKYVTSTPVDIKNTYANTRIELTIYKGF